jgi:hypothetical protein
MIAKTDIYTTSSLMQLLEGAPGKYYYKIDVEDNSAMF